MKPLRNVVAREASTEILSCGHRLSRWDRKRLELSEGSKARYCPTCEPIARGDHRLDQLGHLLKGTRKTFTQGLIEHVSELRGPLVRVLVDAAGVVRRRA